MRRVPTSTRALPAAEPGRTGGEACPIARQFARVASYKKQVFGGQMPEGRTMLLGAAAVAAGE